MKKYSIIFGILFLVAGIVAIAIKNDSFSPPSPPPTTREIVQLSLAEGKQVENLTIPATQVPEFTYDISAQKFVEVLEATGDTLKSLATVSLLSVAHAETREIETEIMTDKASKKLLVKPRDASVLSPGKYLLSLKLRTLEGEVDIEQDFTWGVIAVNTNKSIYRPGETAKIGFGVLNDAGETQCMTGIDSAKVWVSITSPDGMITKLSTEEGTVTDSGECGSVTVTNAADFQTTYTTKSNGIYTMDVLVNIKNGPTRSIKDYFKVDDKALYDIERYDFPTRIYPGSAYPVAFKIIAKEAYNGPIEEIVPDNFNIGAVSEGGTVIKEAFYKKIVWNARLEANREYFFSYLIRFPMVSPEFYLLGPISIGEFEEARQWQVASDAINSISGLVTYEDNNGSNTFSRVWTGTTWSPAIGSGGTNIDPNGGGGDDFPDDSRWFVEKSNPKTGEKLVAAYDNCGAPVSDVCLWMYRWTGNAWAEEDFVFDVDTGASMTTDTRIMDIAYEEVSGEALFVYGDATTQLKYRHRSAGVWSGAQNAGTALDSRKLWVVAKPQFNSDTILVGYLNDNERIGALIWDGSTNTFGNQFDDDDSPAQSEVATSAEQSFDIAIETASGTPMIFWGNTSQQLMYREFTGGAWGGETAIYTTDTDAANDIDWVVASADPETSSNYIALAMHEGFDNDTTDEVVDCEFGMWNGSGAETAGSTIVCRSDADGRLNTVAFENTGGEAVFAYVTSASGNQLSWRTWTSGSGFTGSTTETGSSTSGIESIQLYADLNTTSMIALYAADSSDGDSDPDLYHREWDGSSWSALAGSLYGRIQGAGESSEAYGFGFDRNLETLAAYRWFTANNGVSVSSALTSQNTPYTLTSANQQFRLRLLLYYPDSLSISGRAYDLQYVDPGTGTCASPTGGTPSTWTTITTSTSDPISFHNNATPADADNLTSNASLDPTYESYDPSDGAYVEQDYEESNTFTNSVSAMTGDQVGLWDFSLVDNTTYDRNASAFCFRVVRNGSNLLLQTPIYPQINTAALADVLIQGGSLIQGGTKLQ